MEITCIPMYAVCMKGELCPLRYDSVVDLSEIGKPNRRRVPLQLPKYFGALALGYRALRPAWNRGLKTKSFIAVATTINK